jgi:murein DD-endopeptidase MepM/ murein hydrolase activator NlpD
MARLFVVHILRRNAFVLKANRIIFAKFTLPSIGKTAKAKVGKGAGSIQSSAFGRRVECEARAAYVRTRKLAGRAAPHVRANALAISIGSAAICGILLISSLLAGDVTYYEYSYGGKVLGLVRNESEVYRTVSRPESKKAIDERAGAPVVLGDGGETGIAVKKVIKLESSGVSIDDEETIITNIAALDEVNVIGCAVMVDGKSIGTLGSEKAAGELLDQIKAKWLGGKSAKKYKEIGFAESVSLERVETARIGIETTEEVFSRLEGAAFSSIGVKTVEDVEYEESYRAEPIYIYEENRYEDYRRVVTAGAVGRRKVQAELVCVNGEPTEKNPVSYDVLRPATPSHVIRGTKKLPKPTGNGMFIRPAVGGVVSSPFGRRWGRMHAGIDINVKYAPIYAAKDGRIVYTGNKGDGYGIKIVIDHGDGFETLYGHLAESFVKVGDEVYKGQHIATSGNTGDSTGPHIHFEVRVNGVPRNPLTYM